MAKVTDKTNISRRQLIKTLGVAGAAAGGAVPASALAECMAPVKRWKNWSGAQSCYPENIVAPKSEDELAATLASAKKGIRPVGSGHSFSAVVPTDHTILSIANLAGLQSVDQAGKKATFGAGTLLSQTGKPLAENGLAMVNMPDIDYQSLGGLLATSTHGTGVKYGSMSTQVEAFRLVTPQGEVIDADRQSSPELFNAGRVALGSLGVMSNVTLGCRDKFNVREKLELGKTEEYLEDIDNLIDNNQHWEMQVLTHSDYALGIWLNETDEPANTDADNPEEGGNEFVALIEGLHKYGSDFPGARRALFNGIASQVTFEDRIAASYSIFANVRNVRFNEMEYQVPRDAGPACLREILATIHSKNLESWFPIEYRYVQGDDIWLSQFQGETKASISIHQYYQMDHHHFFAEIEPIFWKYGGRPHWGKLHTLNARQLKALYPHWQDFMDVRAALDPEGKMLNPHLRSVFGV